MFLYIVDEQFRKAATRSLHSRRNPAQAERKRVKMKEWNVGTQLKRWTMQEGNVGTELDPDLWQELPVEILEKVIAKLPFARVITFRSVCKKWCYDSIPRVAAASSRPVLLYFGFHGEVPKSSRGCVWWLQVFNGSSDIGAVNEFQSKGFPAPRRNEDVRLLVCEQGLLFFGFCGRSSGAARDIVVCNPLLSQSKSLGLPCSIRIPSETEWRTPVAHVVMGATFDSEKGSYCFVYAGMDLWGSYVTYVYDSVTCAWTTGCFLPALGHTDDIIDVSATSQRSVCCNGNLYWRGVTYAQNGDIERSMLKFDSQYGVWSSIPNVSVECQDFGGFGDFGEQVGAFKGELLMWHLHLDPLLSEDGSFELLSCKELLDSNNIQPPQYIDWPCRSDGNVKLAPNINLMPHYGMEKIYTFLHKIYRGWSVTNFEYQAFSQENFIYHTAVGRLGLVGLVQDTSVNSFTKLPMVLHKRFPHGYSCHAANVWNFSPSLTALP